MSYWKLKIKARILSVVNIIIYLIPLIVMLIVYKDEMFTTKTGTGLTGLAILGIILYLCGLKHSLGKFPTVVWYVIILFVAYFADYVSEFLVTISLNMLVGYCLSIPLRIYIRKLDKNADTLDDADVREKYKKEKQKEKRKQKSKDDQVVNNEPYEEINGRV